MYESRKEDCMIAEILPENSKKSYIDCVSGISSKVLQAEARHVTSPKVGCTLDDLPYSKWIDWLQEFHACMTTRSLHPELSNFVIRVKNLEDVNQCLMEAKHLIAQS